MKYGKQTVPLKALMHATWLDTEMRQRMDERRAEEYAALMRDDVEFPDPVVFVDPKSEKWRVGDGFHRIKAHAINGSKTIEVDVRRGDYTEAILFNIAANKGHLGLPFSQGDRKRCIVALATNPSTRDWTLEQMASQVGCSNSYVSHVIKNAEIKRPEKVEGKDGVFRSTERPEREQTEQRRQLVAKLLEAGIPESQIADSFGVNKSTIAKDRAAILKERDLIICPHCQGSGYVSNLNGKTTVNK